MYGNDARVTFINEAPYVEYWHLCYRRAASLLVDPAFGDVLDALMLLDLTKVEPAILARYMGRDPLQNFLAYHNVSKLSR